MEAKLSVDWPLNYTGTRLFVMLGTGLGFAAIVMDGMAGRLGTEGFSSLTVPFWLCASVTTLLGYWVVPWLRRLKAGQVIRSNGPQAHLKKAGTPTMGGVFFIPAAVICATLLSGFNSNVLVLSSVTLCYGAIGCYDDWKIINRRAIKGLSPRKKLAWQTGFAALFCLWLAWSQPVSITTIILPFGIAIPLGMLFWLLASLAMVAESNAVNLTDGVDGLAGGTSAIAFLGLGALIGNSSPELMIFCACMSGSCLGFLAFNRNPARVFMGDTGSLALGGSLAAVALLSSNIWGLFILSGIFLVETLSVMAQVSYFKATKGPDGVGKRLLKMAPLHHHLELSGWLETQVVGLFYLINGMLAFLCFNMH